MSSILLRKSNVYEPYIPGTSDALPTILKYTNCETYDHTAIPPYLNRIVVQANTAFFIYYRK